MQIQKITPYSKYSSSKVQSTDAKNPNFGLKIIYDEPDVVSVVGKKNAWRIKRAIDGMNQNMATWFKTIFRNSPKLKLMHGETHVKPFLDESGDIIPNNLIEDWGTLELRPIFIKEGKKIGLDLSDGKIRILEDSAEKNNVVATVTALNKGLEKYVEQKLAKELVDVSFPIEKTPLVQIIPTPEAIRPKS